MPVSTERSIIVSGDFIGHTTARILEFEQSTAVGVVCLEWRAMADRQRSGLPLAGAKNKQNRLKDSIFTARINYLNDGRACQLTIPYRRMRLNTGAKRAPRPLVRNDERKGGGRLEALRTVSMVWRHCAGRLSPAKEWWEDGILSTSRQWSPKQRFILCCRVVHSPEIIHRPETNKSLEAVVLRASVAGSANVRVRSKTYYYYRAPLELGSTAVYCNLVYVLHYVVYCEIPLGTCHNLSLSLSRTPRQTARVGGKEFSRFKLHTKYGQG